jgi:chromosome segregation ATPase
VGVEVLVAKQAWLAACERWRQQLVTAAQRHVATAEAAVELARAQALYRHDESVEVERYRGQYARLHRMWSEAQSQVRPARQAVDSLEALQTRFKQQYAELKSIVLPPPVVPPPQLE